MREERIENRQTPVIRQRHWLAAGDYRWQQGKVGWLVLWLIGIPVPVLLGLFLLRGCT